MPRTMPAGIQQWIRNQGSIAPVMLADVQTQDGTQYFWSDVEGNYPSLLAGTTQFYSGWIKEAVPFVMSNDLSTNSGDLVLQNLSGNTIDKDADTAVGSHEFEGALCAMRIWLPLFDASLMSFHGYLSETNPTSDECSFRHLQLLDSSQIDAVNRLISTLCQWRFKSPMCGSSGSATVCDKLFSTCGDGTHSAVERFAAVLTVVPNVGVSTPPTGAGGGLPPIPQPVGGGGSPRPVINPLRT